MWIVFVLFSARKCIEVCDGQGWTVQHVASGLCVTLLSGKITALLAVSENMTGQEQTFLQVNSTIHVRTGTGLCLALKDVAGSGTPVETTFADALQVHEQIHGQIVARGSPCALTVGVKRLSTSGAPVVLSETMRMLPGDRTLQLQVFIDHTFAGANASRPPADLL